jgi:tRNA pseudouridine38-40 synthase
MQEAAALVAGEHDFTSFAASDPDRALRMAEASGELLHTTNIRTIHDSRFERHGDELVYMIRGNGFLHHMVRNLVGTFLLVGKGSILAAEIPAMIEAKDRKAAGPTAPAEGLYLVEVEY